MENVRREKGGKRPRRPRKNQLLDKSVGFCCTKIEFFVIKQGASAAGMTISNYLRQIVIKGQIVARLTEEERTMFKKLIGISNDLHQLVVKAEKQNATETMLYFVKYADIIDSLINRFSHDQ